MACNAKSSPTTLATLFFFFLLMIFHISMARHHSFPIPSATSSSTSRSHGVGAIKKNVMELGTRRSSSHGARYSKADESTGESSRRRGLGFRVRPGRQPFPWQENMFNAGAHEVPSGPNPISNR
ncbi:PREDICTED: PHAVU_009G244400g [Prunus dulcis]|uniref:PREDICTED: PHAVU_009G244400g n=1 Tax=Prunus dulcis TaxID=3755 RepID=A0A5E4F4Q9_PRUDU|nr:hypothetical protein L3X38_022537 [Prunus dulcis]VVA22089.1 PREDICTED: PHAVU_009G244400g [Prunus dulcis]